MNKITFCIPSKSNLRYLKTCIPSIRKNAYRKDHDIIVFVDSDEDGTVDWLESVKGEYKIKILINPDIGNSLYGIGRAYDKCIQEAKTDQVMIFHADMMLGKYADKKLFDVMGEKTTACSTRVEPPLHPNNGEKILKDFGMWPEEFKDVEFDVFVEKHINSTKVTDGVFAPWMVNRSEFLDIGGHDYILKSCREDSDVFNRMSLAGFTFKQPWNSLVYHLAGRGAGSFSQDKERHEAWKLDMQNSTKEFIRKWGHNVRHDSLMKPIIPHKYDIGLLVENVPTNQQTFQLLSIIEPWVSNLFIDNQIIIDSYIQQEQKNTTFDLMRRVQQIQATSLKENDILLKTTYEKFISNPTENIQFIQQLQDILTESGEIGEMEYGCFKINIHSLKTYEHELIKCTNMS